MALVGHTKFPRLQLHSSCIPVLLHDYILLLAAENIRIHLTDNKQMKRVSHIVTHAIRMHAKRCMCLIVSFSQTGAGLVVSVQSANVTCRDWTIKTAGRGGHFRLHRKWEGSLLARGSLQLTAFTGDFGGTVWFSWGCIRRGVVNKPILAPVTHGWYANDAGSRLLYSWRETKE